MIPTPGQRLRIWSTAPKRRRQLFKGHEVVAHSVALFGDQVSVDVDGHLHDVPARTVEILKSQETKQ